MTEDPYKLLTESIKSMTEPLNELMDNHNEFMASSLNTLNNLKSLNSFQLMLNHKINNKDVVEKEDVNPRKRASDE